MKRRRVLVETSEKNVLKNKMKQNVYRTMRTHTSTHAHATTPLTHTHNTPKSAESTNSTVAFGMRMHNRTPSECLMRTQFRNRCLFVHWNVALLRIHTGSFDRFLLTVFVNFFHRIRSEFCIPNSRLAEVCVCVWLRQQTIFCITHSILSQPLGLTIGMGSKHAL